MLALVTDGSPTRADLGLGRSSPASAAASARAFLYRGLAAGRMGVVAPVSAVGAALLPVCVGIATGERPGSVRVGRHRWPPSPASGW